MTVLPRWPGILRAAVRRSASLRKALAAALSGLFSLLAAAQGGPPLLTDDPETPGDGHWEVNLASIGSRTQDGWVIAMPDADINYGWGDRVQLKVDTPWNAAQQGNHWTNGLGTSLLGFKWRFFDSEESGRMASIYPQLGLNLDPGSSHRGLASPGTSLLLPLENAWRLGPLDLDFEFGRNLQTQGADEWIAGLIVAHSLTPGFELMLETRARASTTYTETLLNLGSRWKLSPSLTLMGALGHEFGSANPGRVDVLYYIGMQVLR